MSEKKESIRLNKFLVQSVGLSRRGADALIKKNQVFVNEKLAKPGQFVDPKKDKVKFKKKPILFKKVNFAYLMMNKPSQVLSSTSDPEGRRTVMHFLPKMKQTLFPVGRLDWDSEGLLLFTNDGDFSQKVLHPKNKIPKTYFVKIRGHLKPTHFKKLKSGVSLPGMGKKRVLFVGALKESKGSSWIKIIISEGKKRQIRLMMEAIGFPVQVLRRVSIGRLKLGKLSKGSVLQLNSKEIEKIFIPPKEVNFSRKKPSKNRSSKKARN